jgi:hypothetical protein
MNTAFIIGNGTSRKGISLSKMKPYGTIFGCNALYRDYFPEYEVPDFLVSIDDGIISEIEGSEFPSSRFIVPPIDERWEPAECNVGRPRSNAGVNAMREAIKMGFDQLICLGFDFLAIDPNQSVSNIFDGTPNYGLNVRANAADNPGRVRYVQWLTNSNPNIDFIFIFPNDFKVNPLFGKNVYFNTYENLLKHT